MLRVSTLSFALVALLGASTIAQNPDSGSPAPAKAAPQSDKPAAPDDKAAGGQKPDREEHVIYVPYQKLPEVFEKEGASVLLPYAQFLQLWAGMQRPLIPIPIKPPVPGLISRASYAGAVDGDLVRLKATYTVEVLGDEWARLPLQFGDAALGESVSDDNVLLRGVGDGTYELLAHGRGQHTLTFELVASIQSSAEGKSFTITCPPVGVSNLELEIAQPDLSVQVIPRRTSQLRPSDKKGTFVQATLGATDKFTVTWQPKSGGAAEMAGLASVTDTLTIELGDGVVHTHAIFDYQILRGSLETLSVTMPADERLLDVQAPGLRDWQSEAVEGDDGAGGGRQRLTVRLHAATRDKVRLEVRTESPIHDKSLPIAQFQAVGVARESGVIAVRSAEDIGLEFVTHAGVSRIDASEVPESLRKPRSTFYKFFGPNFQLAVAAVLLEPRVNVESFLTVTVEKARLTLRGEFKYDISRAGIFTVPLRVPTGFNVDEVQCDSMDRHELSNDENGQQLTVYLTKKVLGQLKVILVASQPRTVQTGELELPLIEPIGVPREQGLVAVIAPDAIEVNSDPTKLESARASTLAELAARGFSPQAPSGSTVAAAFAFARRPVKIELATRERPRRVLATVTTVASVKEDMVSVNTTIHYDIQFAGTDTLRFAVPAGVDKPQIEGDGIKEKRKADEPEEDGSTVWTVLLHAEALGQRSLTITYDDKISVPEDGVTQLVRPVRLLDVDRETGEMAILKDRALAVAATPEGLEEIDSRELTQPVGKEQPYLSYRYFRHPAKLTLAVTKHEIEGVVKTVVSRAYVEAVVSSEGPIAVRARYLAKSSERQRLAITLPAARVLGMTVAGRSVLPEKAPAPPGAAADERSYFINIDRATGPDEPFPISIVYEAAAPPGDKLSMTGNLPIRLPQFEQGIKFQQLYVRLWLPEQFRAIGEPTGFTLESGGYATPLAPDYASARTEDPDAWFPGDSTTFDFRTAGHSYLYGSLNAPPRLVVRYWKDAPMSLAGSLAVLIVGGGLVFFRFEAKVLVAFLAVLGTLLAGMFWQQSVISWVAAARIGLAAVIALWLIMFLLRLRRSIPLRAAAAAAGAGTVLLGTVGGTAGASAEPPRSPPDQAVSGSPQAPPPSLGPAEGQGNAAPSDESASSGRPTPPAEKGESHEGN
jgi:hypothetical protein